MNFSQGTRGIIRTLAVVLSVALPLAITISAADARVPAPTKAASPTANAIGNARRNISGASVESRRASCNRRFSRTSTGFVS